MKKGLLIAAIVLGILIMTMVAIPFVFKGKITQKVKALANESINAKVDFTDVDLSLFRSFPQLNIVLKNLSITGVNEFDNIILLSVESLSSSVNLSSLWRSEGLSISAIDLNHPMINLIVNKNGKANWDISKPSTGQKEAEKSDSQIDLEKIEINQASFSYNDEGSPMLFTLQNGKFNIAGEMKGSNSKLDISGQADSIVFEYGGSRYVSNLKATLEGTLQSDFDKMSFTFLENKLLINKLPVEAQGTFVLGEKDYDFDVTFKSPASAFGDFLGFIPEQYQHYLKGVGTKGDLTFDGFVKGIYSDTTYPGFGINLNIANGYLKYPNLPKEVEKVDITANITKPQGDLDLTTIDIKKFDASIAGNLVTANLHVATPVSDPELEGNLKGKIDFASLKQAIPMDSIDIRGMIDAYIDFGGRYSSIEKEEYDKFRTTGTVTLRDFLFTSTSLPQKMEIKSASLGLTPQSISLTSLSGKMGESDFAINGAISNYWSYIMKKGVLTGNMSLKSSYLNINQLMPTSTATDTSNVAGKPFEVPENINFTIQAAVDKALYDKLSITAISGKMIIKNRKVLLDGLNMNMLTGKLLITGAYITSKNEAPDFDFKIDIKDFDLPKAYQSLSTVRHFIPFAGESTGAFNSGFSLTGKLGNDYSPIFSTVNGAGLLSTKNIELIESKLFSEISKYFKKDLFKQVKVSDFTTNFKIVDGGLEISPIHTKIAGQEVSISGKQTVSKNINYRIDFKVNRADVSEEVTKYIGFVPGAENISKYPIGINLGGSFDKPEVKVDLTEAKKLVETEFKKKANTTIQDAAKKFGLDKLFK